MKDDYASFRRWGQCAAVWLGLAALWVVFYYFTDVPVAATPRNQPPQPISGIEIGRLHHYAIPSGIVLGIALVALVVTGVVGVVASARRSHIVD